MPRDQRRKPLPTYIGVPSVRAARAKLTAARESGHGPDCALAFAAGRSQSVLEHCVCGVRFRLAADSPMAGLRVSAYLLTPAERFEQRADRRRTISAGNLA